MYVFWLHWTTVGQTREGPPRRSRRRRDRGPPLHYPVNNLLLKIGSILLPNYTQRTRTRTGTKTKTSTSTSTTTTTTTIIAMSTQIAMGLYQGQRVKKRNMKYDEDGRRDGWKGGKGKREVGKREGIRKIL